MTLHFHTVVCSAQGRSFDYQGFMDFGFVRCLTFSNYFKLHRGITLTLA